MTYGGYTIEQLNRTIKLFFELNAEHRDLIEEIRVNQTSFFNNDFNKSTWSAFYELEFHEHIMIALNLFGLGSLLTSVTKSENPQSEFLSNLQNELQTSSCPFEFDSKHKKTLILAATFSLGYTMESIHLWGKSLNTLIKEANEGDLEAFTKAIEVDRSCLSCPSANSLLGKAELLDDQSFYKKIGKAVNKRVKTRRDQSSEIRFILYTLHELGVLNLLKEDQLYELIVKELRLYPQYIDQRSVTKAVDRFKEESETNFSKSVSSTLVQRIHIVFSHVINDTRSLDTWQIADTVKLVESWNTQTS